MTIDKQKLKALAEAAGSDEWYAAGDLRYCDHKTGENHGLHHDDSRFIAAASPATILALLAEVESLGRKNANQSESIREYQDLVMGGDVSLGMLKADITVTAGERDQFKAENEALRKDAERYAWLRLGMGKAIVVEPDNAATCDCDRFQVLLEQEVDEIVDAGLAEEVRRG